MNGYDMEVREPRTLVGIMKEWNTNKYVECENIPAENFVEIKSIYDFFKVSGYGSTIGFTCAEVSDEEATSMVTEECEPYSHPLYSTYWKWLRETHGSELDEMCKQEGFEVITLYAFQSGTVWRQQKSQSYERRVERVKRAMSAYYEEYGEEIFNDITYAEIDQAKRERKNNCRKYFYGAMQSEVDYANSTMKKLKEDGYTVSICKDEKREDGPFEDYLLISW